MIIKTIFSKYNIGIKNIEKFLISQGLLIIKNYQDLEADMSINIEKFLSIIIIKQEILFKQKHDNIFKKLDNGSYIGYKRFRGLPIKNQRTKTNSRNSRKSILS